MSRALVLAVVMSLALAAPAAARQSIAASPNPVRYGQTLVVTGKGWPVIEFCSRTVRLVAAVRPERVPNRNGAGRRPRPVPLQLDPAPHEGGHGALAADRAYALRERQGRVAGADSGVGAAADPTLT